MVELDLIIKYFAGDATPEEAMKVDDWATASNANTAFLKSTHKAWLEAGNEVYHVPDVTQEWERLNARIRPPQTAPLQPSRYLWLTRVAALLAIIATGFAGYYVFNRNNQNQPNLTAEATDHNIELKLKDGSLVNVAAQSTLIYPEIFAKDKRELTLVGSGHFEVEHNAAQPFYVHMGGLHVKVLGTSFAIATGKEKVAVTVTRGMVAFYNNTDTVLVAEGNAGSYDKASHKFALTATAPLKGSFHFNNTPLSEVAAQLSAHFKVTIAFADPGIRNCRISAGFEQQDLKEILSAISATFNIEYQIKGNKIQLSGHACE